MGKQSPKQAKQDNTVNFYTIGQKLGTDAAKFDAAYGDRWNDVVGALATKADRVALRSGFCDAYMVIELARGKSKAKAMEAAQNRFSYLGRLYSPVTSRKVAHNNKVKAKKGAPSKTGATVTEVSGKVLALRITNGMNHAALMMAQPGLGDEQMAAWSTQVAVLNGDAGADGKAIKRKGKTK